MTEPTVHHLPPVVLPTDEEPADIGTGHVMRAITERVAADAKNWTPAVAAQVADFFGELAPEWQAETSARSQIALADLLDRVGAELTTPVLELGAGTGSGTVALAAHFGHVVAGDLTAGMIQRLPAELAARVQLDASALPVRSGSVATLVCVNMFLFAEEVRRVLLPRGALVWVNSIGERTPIHLSAEQVAASMGPEFAVTASRAGWCTWAIARRAA
ncbi:MAG: class I SAM-dependent methyltransferase [Microthrixaceae bacterium]